MAGEYQSIWTGAEIDAGIQKANDASPKENGVYYIEGTGTTAGTWLGSHSDITEYYAGLKIAYKIGIAGLSDGTTLNINNLGAVTVVRNATTAISTAFPVNSVVFLVYTVDGSTAYWKTADYDANSYAYVRQYYTTANNNYPLLMKYDAGITTTTSYVTKYTRCSNKMYFNPSTGNLTVPSITVDGVTFSSLISRLAALESALANKQDKIETWGDLKGGS